MVHYLGRIIQPMDESFFQAITPEPTIRYLLTVEETRFARVHTKLNELLPRKLSVGLTNDGTMIMLREGVDDCFTCVKDGRIKNKAVGNALAKLKVVLPACYEMQLADNGVWYGVLLPPEELPSRLSIPKKPRTRGLDGIGKELAHAS